MVITHRSTGAENYRMDYRNPHLQFEPLGRRSDVVAEALEMLKRTDTSAYPV